MGLVVDEQQGVGPAGLNDLFYFTCNVKLRLESDCWDINIIMLTLIDLRIFFYFFYFQAVDFAGN